MSTLRRPSSRHNPVPEPRHAVSVTSSPGTPQSGPMVALEIQLPQVGLLTLDMRQDEAYDLANELLAAIAMAQTKHQQEFGPTRGSF